MRGSAASSLNPDQIEELCERAEEAARRYILSRIPKRRVSELTIIVETGGTDALTVDVDVEVRLSPLMRRVDVDKLVKGAVEAAFEAVDDYLEESGCRSGR